jgi:WD40 repeat protein
MVLSADGNRMATIERPTDERKECGTELWDLAGGKVQSQGKLESLPNFANALVFSPDGKRLAAACENSTLWLWDISGNKPSPATTVSTAGKSHIKALAFSPDGQKLAFAGHYGAVPVYVLDLTTLKEVNVRELLGHRGDIHALAFAPDSQTLASGSKDGTIRLWDMASMKERGRCETGSSQINALIFSPEPQGKTLVSADVEGEIIFWESATGKRLRGWKFPGVSGVAVLAFAPDGRHLLVGMANGLVHVLRLEAASGFRP